MSTLKTTILRWLSPLLLLTIWQLAADRGLLDSHFFPAPSASIAVAWRDLMSGKLLVDSLGSIERLFGGLAIGVVTGVLLGLAMGIWRWVDAIFTVPVQILRVIPPIAWIGFAILWFGLGSRPAIFLISLGVVFPMLINTYSGVRQADLIYLRAARNLGANGWLMFKDVLFAAALPSIMTGLRVSVGIAWILVVVGELIGAPNGLGATLMRSQDYQQSDRMLAYMLVIGLYGYLSDILVVALTRYVLRWQRGIGDA